MDASPVLFAIEAGVKLGRKIQDVFVEGAAHAALPLPLGDLVADVSEQNARAYFDRKANSDLIRKGGPYHGLKKDDLVRAYKIQLRIADRLGGTGTITTDPTEVALQLHKIEQSKKGDGPKPAIQRILGTVVEIGIDYFNANPSALGRDSDARKIVEALVTSLDEVDFAEGEGRQIFSDLLGAALGTLDANLALVSDDEKLQALLGGIGKTLIEDVKAATTEGAKIEREKLFKKLGSGILRGAATAFSENIGLFMPRDDAAKKLVQSTLTQVLAGIKGKEDLFTGEALEILYKSALTAAAENVALLSDKEIIQQLVTRSVKVLTSAQGSKLFSSETVAAILKEALEVVGENLETLIDVDDPQKQLLASALQAMTSSLATSLAGGGNVKDLLSKRQLVELTRIVFEEVAKHPEQLLGANLDDPKKTVLAQVIASVASALGDDPTRLVNGRGFVELVKIALDVALENVDKLVNLSSASPKANALFKVISQIVEAVKSVDDPRELITRAVFLDLVKRVLPVVSANLNAFLEGKEALKTVVEKALELASGVLEGRINGANLPALIRELLLEILWNELDIEESAAVQRSAERILRAA